MVCPSTAFFPLKKDAFPLNLNPNSIPTRFCAAAAFSPSLAGSRPALHTVARLHTIASRSVVMFGACEDTICFYLQSAKPSKLQSLTPTELQAQIDLLQSRLESVKSGTWMQPPSVPFSDSDSVSWALSKAKESGLEKLSAGGRQEQMELLEKQLYSCAQPRA